MDCLSTGADACRTRSIEQSQVDTLCDVLNGSERFVRTLSSSRGRTSPPQHGVAPRRLGGALCLAVHFRRGWLGIDSICADQRMIRRENADGLRPRLIPAGDRRPGSVSQPGRRPWPGAATPKGRLGKPRAAHELGIQWATRELYGIAVTVRDSSSLFSLRRCVSKRSPTLKDVTFWMERPVRLYITGRSFAVL